MQKRARGSRMVPSLYGLWRAGVAVQALAQSLPPDQAHQQQQVGGRRVRVLVFVLVMSKYAAGGSLDVAPALIL